MAATSPTARTVIVTGGRRGIGEAIARRLAAGGDNVVACGRSAGPPDARSTTPTGGVTAVRCDVSSPEDVRDLVNTTVGAFGGIDAIVNNAAHVEMKPLEEITPADFDHTFAVNVRGPLLVANTAIEHLRRSPNASIVNILSVAVDMGGPTMALYRSSKSALLGLTKVMAREWGPSGVRVNAVSPGKVDTDDAAVDPDIVALAAMATPLQRLGTVAEVADAVAFLLGDSAGYVNGAVLTVDGGVSA